MEFLYRYYYHFFKLHRRDRLTGLNKNIPWFSTLSQLALGTLCLILGLYWGLTWLAGATSKTGGIQKHHIFVLLPLCFLAWYYALFDLLKVDKMSGKSELFSAGDSKETGPIYWIVWVGSLCLPVVIAILRNV